MEALFENRYTKNPEMYKELYQYYYFKRPLIMACNVCYALFILWTVFCIIAGLPYSPILIILPLVMYAFEAFRYFSALSIAKKRDAELGGQSNMETAVIVTDNFMRYTAVNGAEVDVEYSVFKNAVCTKNLILLRSKARLVYIIPKDTFTKGDPNAFLAFLSSKGIKVK